MKIKRQDNSPKGKSSFVEEPIIITKSSGNVFADIGLPDAETLKLKSWLIMQISDIIKSQKWTQAEAAKMAGMTQPEVSKMLRGNLDSVSVERLLDVLNRLGCDVEVKVKKGRKVPGTKPGVTRVLAAA